MQRLTKLEAELNFNKVLRQLLKELRYTHKEAADLLHMGLGNFNNKISHCGACFNVAEMLFLSEEFTFDLTEALKGNLVD